MTTTERAYTWAQGTNDIALMTRLTLKEAGDLTYALQSLDVRPYDMVPHLVVLVNATTGGTGGAIGAALRALLTEAT